MRKRRQPLQVSTFPFLAVLLCTMGSLLLLLLVIDRQAKVVARRKALLAAAKAAESGQREADRRAEWEKRRRDLQALLAREADEVKGKVRAAHGKEGASAHELEAERERSRELRQRLLKEQDRLLTEQSALAARRGEVGQKAKEAEASRGRLARMAAELEEMELALKALQELRRRERQTYSLVPYKGKRGDNRRPLYLECTAGGVIFHPDRLALEGADNDAGRIRAEVQRRIAAQRADALPAADRKPDGKEASAYLLMLIRPEGILSYYHAMRALDGVKVDFGYEFIDADWVLDFAEDKEGTTRPWHASQPSAAPPALPRPGKVVGARPGVPLGGTAGPDSLTLGGSPGSGGGLPVPGGALPVPGGKPGSWAGGTPGPGFAVGGGSGQARLGFGAGPGGFVAGSPGRPYAAGVPGGVPGGMPGGVRAGVPGALGSGAPDSGLGGLPGAVGGVPGGAPGAVAAGPIGIPGIRLPGAGGGVGTASGGGSGVGLGGPSGAVAGGTPGGSAAAAGNGGAAGAGSANGQPGAPGRLGFARPGDGSTPGQGGLPFSGGAGGAQTGGTPIAVAGSPRLPGPGGGPGGGVPGAGTSAPGGADSGPGFAGQGGGAGGATGMGGAGDPKAAGGGGAAGAPPGAGGSAWKPGQPGVIPPEAPGAKNQQGSSGLGSAADAAIAGSRAGATEPPIAALPGQVPSAAARPGARAGPGRPGGVGSGGAGSGEGDDDDAGPPPPRALQRTDVGPVRPARPRTTFVPLSRVIGNRDWVITIECNADAVIVQPWGTRFTVGSAPAPGQEHPLAQTVRKLVDRRQASVRPGEPPYRPLLRFQVHPSGLRGYYFAYPLLERLRIPMSRENLDK